MRPKQPQRGHATTPDIKGRSVNVDELAALDLAHRRELAAALRSAAEMFAEVRDGKTASYVLGVLARLLDPA